MSGQRDRLYRWPAVPWRQPAAPPSYTGSIDYVPDQVLVESKSLKLYLGAFRNRARFSATVFSIERGAAAHAERCAP